MDDWEGLCRDIEARKNRDQLELNSWYIAASDKLENDRQATIERLKGNGLGVQVEFERKLQMLEDDKQSRAAANSRAHNRLEEQLREGTLTHVWISAEDEKNYSDAKRIWDYEINDTKEHSLANRAFKADELIERFKKQYGSNIVKQIIADSKLDLQKEQERNERIKADKESYRLEQELKERADAEQKKMTLAWRDFNQNNQKVTDNAIYSDRQEKLKNEHPDVTMYKIRQKVDRQSIEETKQRLEAEKKADREEKLALFDKVASETKRQRDKNLDPLNFTGDIFDQMLKDERERQRQRGR